MKASITIGLSVFMTACAHAPLPQIAKSSVPATVPRVELSHITIDDLGNNAVRIEADGFQDYITQYGKAGWLAGLTDERWLFDATHLPAGFKCSKEEIKDLSDDFRVRDLFCIRYLARNGRPIRQYLEADEIARSKIIDSVMNDLKNIPST